MVSVSRPARVMVGALSLQTDERRDDEGSGPAQAVGARGAILVVAAETTATGGGGAEASALLPPRAALPACDAPSPRR